MITLTQSEVLQAAQHGRLWVSYSLGRGNPLYGVDEDTLPMADVAFALFNHYIQRRAIGGPAKAITYQLTTRGHQALREAS